MNFTLTDGNGNEVQDICKCDNCDHIQTRHNFGDDDKCPMCQHSGFEKIDTVKKQTGMSSFQYRKLLTAVQQSCSGVGDATIEGIREQYPDGEAFVSSCEEAYNEQAYGPLTEVSGVGESTARKIALGMAEVRDWEDGLAESKFNMIQ